MKTEEQRQLESKLTIGAKVFIGHNYSKEFGFYEGQVIELVEGSFEYDNGLYTENESAPAVWDEEQKEFDSIYHLFGNDLEHFLDCKIVTVELPEVVHSETEPESFYCRDWEKVGNICEQQCKRCKKTENFDIPDTEPKEFIKSELREAVRKAFEAGKERQSKEDFGSIPCTAPDLDDYLNSINL